MATNINTILNWFKTGFKPTQAQFWAAWASFWHKDEQIPQNNISGLEIALNEKAEKAQFDDHLSNKKAHSELFDKKANSIHTHSINDIESLENTLNEKALLAHTHEIGEIKELENALNEKASLAHTHEIVDIKGLESTLNEKAEKSQLDSHLRDENAHADLFNKKVDKIDGMGLSQEDFTTSLKDKLENFQLDPDKFQGQFTSLEDLLLAHPEGVAVEDSEGWSAYALVEGDLVLFIWDFVALKWIAVNDSPTSETPLSIKQKYESNINTNVFDDAAKNKLAGINNTVLATDAETQISVAVVEDNKVISPSKLFNWFNWIKSLPLKWNNTITTLAGTATAPALIIPNGVLTTTPQNGAIERDSAGNLHHVAGSSRYRLLDERDFSKGLTATWQSKTNFGPWIPSRNDVDFTKMDEVSIPSTTLGNGGNKGVYLFKTTDEYLIKNGSYASGKTPPKGILFEAFLKGNNCTFSGNPAIRLYSVLRTDIDSWMNYRSYEVPLVCYLGQSSGKYFSIINFSEKTHDNLGNVTSETFKKYYLYALDGSGIYFSNASISVQYRITVLYEDSQNSLGLNSTANPSFSNMSTLFLKIQ